MPINRFHQRAKLAPVVDPEQPYRVEAGDSDGLKFDHVIQYGRDFEFQLNHDKATTEFKTITQVTLWPRFKGTVMRGQFSQRAKFRPTWARLYRGDDLIDNWTRVPHNT